MNSEMKASGMETNKSELNWDDDPILCVLSGMRHPEEEEEIEEEEIKKPKQKSWRQIRHEQDLKARGKWKEPGACYNPNDRFTQYPNSNVVFQLTYKRQTKPKLGTFSCLVTHVESAREIYLQSDHNEHIAAEIDKELVELYEGKEVPSLPYYWLVLGNACVVKHEGKWYRCRIHMIIRRMGVQLYLSDVGRRSPIIPSDEFLRLKVLLRGEYLDNDEQAYHSKVASLCEVPLSKAEKDLIKELLPVGTRIPAEFDHKGRKVGPPWLVRIAYGEASTQFEKVFQEELKKRGLHSGFLERQKVAASQRALRLASVPSSTAMNKANDVDAAALQVDPLRFNMQQDEGSDRDETTSLRDFGGEQETLLANWITGGDRVYPMENTDVGLSFNEIKAQQSGCYWDYDSEESDDVVLLEQYEQQQRSELAPATFNENSPDLIIFSDKTESAKGASEGSVNLIIFD